MSSYGQNGGRELDMDEVLALYKKEANYNDADYQEKYPLILPTGSSNGSDQSGPKIKPNKRFLRHLLTDTEGHNIRLLERERISAEKKVEEFESKNGGTRDKATELLEVRDGEEKFEKRKSMIERTERSRSPSKSTHSEDIQREDSKYYGSPLSRERRHRESRRHGENRHGSRERRRSELKDEKRMDESHQDRSVERKHRDVPKERRHRDSPRERRPDDKPRERRHREGSRERRYREDSRERRHSDRSSEKRYRDRSKERRSHRHRSREASGQKTSEICLRDGSQETLTSHQDSKRDDKRDSHSRKRSCYSSYDESKRKRVEDRKSADVYRRSRSTSPIVVKGMFIPSWCEL